MVFFRWFVGLPLAAIITAGLFAMMAGLIGQNGEELPPVKPYTDVDIWAQKPQPEPVPIKQKRPQRKDPPETINPPTTRQGNPGPRPVPPSDGPIGIDPRETGPIGAPVITFPPPYPENCRSRAAEGTVTVQFDVTPEGNVVNPRIIQTADRCFNRTVIRTVSKWKYPPAAKGSRTGMRRGVTTVIRFELQE